VAAYTRQRSNLRIAMLIGVFRKSCELSLKLLRDNREMLCNVLETFVHDPLLEWVQKKDKVGRRPSSFLISAGVLTSGPL